MAASQTVRLICVSALFLSASAVAAQPVTLGPRDPSEPWRTPPPEYRSVTGDMKSFKPVEPLPWGEVNRRVAPKPEADGEKKN